MNKKIGLIIVLALLVGGVIGFGIASYVLRYSALTSASPTQPPMLFVSGMIKSVSGQSITIELPQAAGTKGAQLIRTVDVTSATKIVRATPKDPAVFNKEMAAFQQAMQKYATPLTQAPKNAAPPTPPTPPAPVIESPISLSDLKAGDLVTVDGGKNVATLASFDAVKISVIVPPSAAPVAPGVRTATTSAAKR